MTENNPHTVELDKPLQRGEQTITHITVTPPPDSGALRGVRLSELMQLNVEALAIVLPRVTTPTLTQHDVYRLAPADLVELSSKVVDFLLPKSARENTPTV